MRRAFTLVELLIGVAIISIIVILICKYSMQQEVQKDIKIICLDGFEYYHNMEVRAPRFDLKTALPRRCANEK
jgi:prepilin-type N-terminal cleavage/methylation domain-containing protein